MDAKSPDWAHKLVQRHACAARALEHMYTEKNVKRLIEVGAELEAALAALPSDAAQAPQAAPDMVWLKEDTEQFAHSIDEAVDDYVNSNWPVPSAGGEIEFETAHRLPDVKVRVWRTERATDDAPGYGWEIIEAAPVAPASAAQPDERAGLETVSKLSTDAVTQLSTETVDKPVNRMSDTLHENGHQFEKGEALGFSPGSVLYVTYVCRHCGVVRNDEGQNRPCRGAVRITTRDEGNRTPIDGDRITQGK